MHQQSLISAERSVIELWLDMELLHRNVLPDGVERMMTFVAQRLGLDEEFKVLDGYDVRNFAVHTGLSGVMGFDQTTFEAMCSKALRNIADCMVSALKIIGRELEIHTTA